MISQVLGTIGVRFMLIGAGFLSSIITARMLGPEGRGVFFYWTTLIALAIQFGNLGLHSSNTYYLVKGRARLSTLVANSLWASVVAGSIASAFVVGAFLLSGRSLQDEWVFLLSSLLLIPSGLFFLFGSNLYVALQRFREYNSFELVNRYVGLVAISLAAWLYRSPESLLAALALVSLAVCVALHGRLKNQGGKGQPSLLLFRQGIAYGMRAYVIAVMALLVLRANALVLERFVEVRSLGVWSIAAQLLDVIVIVPATFALVLFPKLVESDQPYRLMRSQLRIVAIVLAVLCLIAILLGRSVILFVYGEQFGDAYEMLMWGLPGALGLGLVSILSQYLAAEGIPTALLWIWGGGLAVELAFAIVLVPDHGAVGAMAALSITYLIVLAMIWTLIARMQGDQIQKVQDHAG